MFNLILLCPPDLGHDFPKMTPNQLAHLRVEIPFSRKRSVMRANLQYDWAHLECEWHATIWNATDSRGVELRHVTGAQTALMLDISYCLVLVLCFSCISGRNWCRANRTDNNSKQLICLCSQGPVQEPLAYSTPAHSEGICCNINYALQATTPRGARFVPIFQ